MAPTTSSRTIRIRGLNPLMETDQFVDLATSLVEKSLGKPGLYPAATQANNSSQSRVKFFDWSPSTAFPLLKRDNNSIAQPLRKRELSVL